ncbi:MAG: tetratricopeptide repeat protein, partial [Thermoplasmata archaeon]|nr:tetratricopeptide repeat protein [Thermoplasmata archaeon]NIW88184.1 tetratricopeptide repeat protein [Thermoplasmata archaeon]NIY02872.1 tetratricopeptide repeat protein [Thermoplasmata archaeon]
AECYMAQEDYENAKGTYRQAIELAEEESQKILLYGQVLQAEEKLVGEKNLGEDGLEALLELAKLYVNQDKNDEAKAQLERIKEEDPDWRPEE